MLSLKLYLQEACEAEGELERGKTEPNHYLFNLFFII